MHFAVLCPGSSVTRRIRLGRRIDIVFLAASRAYDLEILRGQIFQEGGKSCVAVWTQQVSFLVAHAFILSCPRGCEESHADNNNS